jgi:hypothetical protein
MYMLCLLPSPALRGILSSQESPLQPQQRRQLPFAFGGKSIKTPAKKLAEAAQAG